MEKDYLTEIMPRGVLAMKFMHSTAAKVAQMRKGNEYEPVKITQDLPSDIVAAIRASEKKRRGLKHQENINCYEPHQRGAILSFGGFCIETERLMRNGELIQGKVNSNEKDMEELEEGECDIDNKGIAQFFAKHGHKRRANESRADIEVINAKRAKKTLNA